MEEIGLVLGSLAGACTAVAVNKLPKRKNRQGLVVNTPIENQLHSLKIEKEILTKTITRLQNHESSLSESQHDKLLVRYQHQLGITIAKIERLESAKMYPDLGPIGDSLVSLMDNKLAKLDERLHEISSKIAVNNLQPRPAPAPQKISQPAPVPQVKQQEQPAPYVEEKLQVRKIEPQIETRRETEVQREQPPKPLEDVQMPERRKMVELSTLTEISSKMPEFPPELIKPVQTPRPGDAVREHVERILREPAPSPPADSGPPQPKAEPKKTEPPAPKEAKQVEDKVQLPTPMKIPDEEKIEDDDKDLDKIKSEIMKALSKLEQVEVE